MAFSSAEAARYEPRVVAADARRDCSTSPRSLTCQTSLGRREDSHVCALLIDCGGCCRGGSQRIIQSESLHRAALHPTFSRRIPLHLRLRLRPRLLHKYLRRPLRTPRHDCLARHAHARPVVRHGAYDDNKCGAAFIRTKSSTGARRDGTTSTSTSLASSSALRREQHLQVVRRRAARDTCERVCWDPERRPRLVGLIITASPSGVSHAHVDPAQLIPPRPSAPHTTRAWWIA